MGWCLCLTELRNRRRGKHREGKSPSAMFTIGFQRPGPHALAAPALLSLLLGSSLPVHALPRFARQTGEECTVCHIGGFGPQLTPHGMRFKLGGYIENNGDDVTLLPSAMLVGSYSRTKSATDSGSDHKKALQEASLFLAGRLSDHIGGFVQATTASGVHGRVSMDNVDVRVVYPTESGDTDVVMGLSLNNNPTMQDPLNTLPAWRFPYMASEMVEAPSVLLDEGLGQQVLGLTGYALWDGTYYAELGGYRDLPLKLLDNVNVDAELKVQGTAPYWRLAYLKDLHSQAWSVGAVALDARVRPGYEGHASDKFRDVGVDAGYQYLGDRTNIFTLNTSYVHERQTRDASVATGDAANREGRLNRFDVNGSWYYKETYGLTTSYFDVNGSADPTLYDSRSGSPNTRGYIVQGDWTPWGKEDSWGAPWANVRLALQYTRYTEFLGDGTNYDGNGRDASDNDTLYAFVWMVF